MYDSDELRALAESSLGGTLMTAREKLYQAMTPVVVLELLDEIEALRHDIERHIANHTADLNAIVSDREEFEAWMRTGELDLTPDLERDGDVYEDWDTQRAWRGWQAARAAIGATKTQGGGA